MPTTRLQTDVGYVVNKFGHVHGRGGWDPVHWGPKLNKFEHAWGGLCMMKGRETREEAMGSLYGEGQLLCMGSLLNR